MTGLTGSCAREFKKTRRLAMALLAAAPLVYLLVMSILDIEARSGGEVDMLFYVLLIVAMAEPAAAPLIQRFQLSRYRGGGSTRMSPGQLLTSIGIIKFALVESIYVYGVIVYIISGDVARMLYFYAVGVVWSVVYWPRRPVWEKLCRQAELK